MKKISLLCLLVAVVLCLNGFGPRQRIIELTENNTGQQIRIKQHQRVRISLKSTPTTGYSWKIKKLDTKIMRKLEAFTYVHPVFIEREPVYVPSMPWFNRGKRKMRLGAAGSQVLELESVGKGTAEIKIIYRRPWEKGRKPAKVFKVKLYVD